MSQNLISNDPLYLCPYTERDVIDVPQCKDHANYLLSAINILIIVGLRDSQNVPDHFQTYLERNPMLNDVSPRSQWTNYVNYLRSELNLPFKRSIVSLSEAESSRLADFVSSIYAANRTIRLERKKLFEALTMEPFEREEKRRKELSKELKAYHLEETKLLNGR